MEKPIIFRQYITDGEIVALLPSVASGNGPHGIVAYTQAHGEIHTSTADMQPQVTTAVDPQKHFKECLDLVQQAVHAGHYPLVIKERILEHMNEQRMKALKHIAKVTGKTRRLDMQKAA